MLLPPLATPASWKAFTFSGLSQAKPYRASIGIARPPQRRALPARAGRDRRCRPPCRSPWRCARAADCAGWRRAQCGNEGGSLGETVGHGAMIARRRRVRPAGSERQGRKAAVADGVFQALGLESSRPVVSVRVCKALSPSAVASWRDRNVTGDREISVPAASWISQPKGRPGVPRRLVTRR